MASQAQIDANRQNAQSSTGPKTEEGKQASSQNATKHGLSSNFAVLEHEDQDEFDELFDTYAAEFNPRTEHERFLVELMAQSRWRLDRIRRFEECAFDDILYNFSEPSPDLLITRALCRRSANVFDLLHRYATAAENAYHRAHRELIQARAASKRNEAKEAQVWLKRELELTPILSHYAPDPYVPDELLGPSAPGAPVSRPFSRPPG